MFNLTITNVRASATRLYAFGAPLREVLPYVPLFSGHAVGIAVVSYAGGLVFGLGADRTSTPDLATLAEGVEASFAELHGAAGERRRGGHGGTAASRREARTADRRGRASARGPPRRSSPSAVKSAVEDDDS